MKLAVLGAGALGSTLGAALAEAGAAVWLVSRPGPHAEAIRARGLTVCDDDGERRVAIRVVTDPAEPGPVDLVIVLVKSFHTQAAIDGARALFGPHTAVLSLQNGLGHEDLLAAAVGRERVLAGKTYVGGVLLDAGRIRSGVRGKDTLIGELDAGLSERVRAVAAEFSRAGLATTVSTNIFGVLWDKLFVNVATGALSAITRLPYGELYRVPEVEATAVAAVAEAMAVARARGVEIATREPREAWVKAGAGLPPSFKASMLQSLDKGSITEVDFINGAVVRHGLAAGVPTPVNQTLVAAVKGIERASTAGAR